jgi:hypothetical protein
MRHIFTVSFSLLLLTGCQDRVICPAFQSTYILDDSVRIAYYSPLWKIEKEERDRYLAEQKSKLQPLDSLGAVVASVGNTTDYFAYVEPYVLDATEVKKTKYGIVKYEPYWLKNYRLRTAPMEDILAPPLPVTEPVVEDVGEFLASDFIEDTPTDTSVVANLDLEVDADTFEIPTLAIVEPPKPTKEIKYLYRYDPNDKALNVEQAYYNKHFGQQLYTYVAIKPPAPPVSEVPEEEKVSFLDFFKNLFKGGMEETADDPAADPDLIEESAVDETAVDEVVEDTGTGF